MLYQAATFFCSCSVLRCVFVNTSKLSVTIILCTTGTITTGSTSVFAGYVIATDNNVFAAVPSSFVILLLNHLLLLLWLPLFAAVCVSMCVVVLLTP